MVREYCYQVLESAEKAHFHIAAAGYYQEMQKYLSAGYHFFEGGANDLAVDCLTGHVREIVNAGGASALREQLSKFKWLNLTSNQKARISQARGDTYRMEGKYQQALEAYDEALERIRDPAKREIVPNCSMRLA